MDMDNHGRESPHTLAPHIRSERFALKLDSADERLLNELNKAESDGDVLLTDLPVSQKLGTFSVICLIVNGMIGAGIYSTPSRVVLGTNSIAIALIFWIVGSIAAFIGVSIFLELGLSIPKYTLEDSPSDQPVAVPRSGGEKNYLEYMYSRPRYLATCVFAFCFICLGTTGGNALTFAEYFLYMTGNKSPSDAVLRGVAVAVITFACLLHGGWRAGGIYFSNTLACLKVGTLLVVICCGLAAHTGKIRGVHSEFPSEIKASGGKQTPWSISNALLSVLFSYGGYNNANYALSEIKRPHHTLKFGAYSAVGLVSMLYILTIIAYSGALSQEEIATAGTRVAQQFFKNVFERQGDAGPRAMSGLIALSSLGNLIVVTFVGSRVNQEIAKEGVLPFSKFFAMNRATLRARLSGPQSQSGSIPESSPVAALCLYWIFSVIIALAPPMDVAYSFFVELYSYTILVWLSFFLTIGLLWQQWKPGSTWVKERNFKPWGGPLMAIIYLIINLFLIIAPFIPPDKTSEQKIASTMRQAEGYPLKKTTIPWYVSPTVGVSIFVAGAIYWIMFRFFWPKISRRELQVKRIPVLLDGIQVKEFVECKWVIPDTNPVDIELNGTASLRNSRGRGDSAPDQPARNGTRL